MNINRREFLFKSAAAAGAAALGGCKLPGYCGLGESVYGGIPIGVITFSYWHMPVGYLSCLKYVKDSGLSSVELMGYDLEVDAGAPIWKLPWDQTADEQAERAAWRAKVEPEKLYADVRALYADHGVGIHILKPECNLDGRDAQSDAELDYWFKAAKALGAKDFEGSWGVTIPADYDDIGEKVVHLIVTKDAAGKYEGLMLWRWGSPEKVKDLKVADGKFSLKHPYGPTVEGEWEGDDLYLHYTCMVNGKLKDSREILKGSRGLKGHRNPPVPAERIDTRAAKLGEPIDLLKDGLAGWETIPGQGRSCWSFKDGTLSNDVGLDEKGHWKGGGLNLRTKRADFTDFNLEYDVRVATNSNSGVYLRGRYEIQTVDSFDRSKRKVKKPDCHDMAAYYGRVAPSTAAERKPGEWQHVNVTLYKGHLTVWLNGVNIIRNAPVTGITGGALDAEEGKPGPIYVQGDHSNADYRNMVLRPVAELSG